MEIFNSNSFHSILAPLILLIILIACGNSDVKSKKIPNILTISGILFGVIFNTYLYGYTGLLSSLISIVVVFVLFIVPYLLKQFGAGDIKLLIMVASIMNFYYCIGATIMSSIFCAIYAIINSIRLKSFKFTIPFGLFMCIGTIFYQILIYIFY